MTDPTTSRPTSFWARLAEAFFGRVERPAWMTPQVEQRLDALTNPSRKPDSRHQWEWLERQPDWAPLVPAHWAIVGSGEWRAAQKGSGEPS